MNKTETTGINTLLQKYNNEIAARAQQIEYHQKLIETDRAVISNFKEKINILNELSAELKTQTPTLSSKAEQKWGGLNNITTEPIKPLSALKFSDLTSRGQFNSIYTKPVTLLTKEQIQDIQNTFIGLPQDNYMWASIHYNNKTP